MRILINVVAFQIGWFACVLGAAYEMPFLGTGIALTIVVLHLASVVRPVAELKLILSAAGIGIVFDSLLAASGVVRFASGAWSPVLTAHWMVALWMLFATTINVSLRWLKERAVLAAVFGGVGGPLAYIAGVKLGALQLDSYGPAMIAIGAGWAVAMVALIRLARRFDGTAGTSPVLRPA